MKHSFLTTMCGLSLGLLTVACSDDELTETNTNNGLLPQSELKLVKVPVNIGTADKSATRGMKQNDSGYAVYDFDSMTGKQYELLLCLKYTGSNTSYTGQVVYTKGLKPTLTDNGDGTLGFTLSNADVNIISGTSLSDYTKVCALLNTGLADETFESAFIPADGETTTTIDMSSLPYIDANGDKEASNMAVPMYSSYSNSSITTTDGSKITLDFHLMGTVITATGNTNPLCVPIRINSVELRKANVETGSAKFTFGSEDGSGNPSLSFTNSTNDQACTFTLPNKTDINPNFTDATATSTDGSAATETSSTLRADFWCMPVGTTDFKTHYSIDYSLIADDGSSYSEDYVSYAKNTTDTTAVALSGGFKGGNSYQLSFALPSSDLMITEFEQRATTGYNYSMVEIYNPTNEVKDLRNYGIARHYQLAHNGTVISSNKHPSLYIAAGSSETEDLSEARLQDLWIQTDGAKDVRVANGTAAGDDFPNNFHLMYDYNSGYTSTSTYSSTIGDVKYTWSLEPYQLAPGQSVVLFAGGMYYEYEGKESPNTVELPSGSDMYNCDYLERAVKTSGECKYVIAVDNGATQLAYSTTESGGVMQFGHDHNAILMKYNESTKEFTFLDAGLSLNPLTNFDYCDWCYNNPFSTVNNLGSMPRYMTRKEAVMYPVGIRSYDDSYTAVSQTMRDQTYTGRDQSYSTFDWYWDNTTKYFHISDYPRISPGTKYLKGAYLTTTSN